MPIAAMNFTLGNILNWTHDFSILFENKYLSFSNLERNGIW